MSALPSLSDVVFVLVVLLPGFISLILLRWIAIFESELSETKLVIWSLFLSLIIYSIFGIFTGVADFDTIRDTMLIPANLLKIFGLSIAIGLGSGLAIRAGFRGSIVRGDSWEASMKAASKEGTWVIVYTVDGSEYQGALHYSGGKGFPKELSIRQPVQVFRDSKSAFEEKVEMGKEILFTEKNIARIVFFKEV